MPVELTTLTRPKKTTTIAFVDPPNITTTVTENNTNKTVTIKTVDTVDPASFTVTGCATTNNNDTLTTTLAKFAEVRVGDAVSGTGIANGTTVSAKNSNNNSLTLSANATATGSGVTITFNPPEITYVLQTIVLSISGSGSSLVIDGVLYQYDGTVASGSETVNNAISSTTLPSVTHNIDSIRTRVRDYRVDS
jgi:hypothetical protein